MSFNDYNEQETSAIASYHCNNRDKEIFIRDKIVLWLSS